MTILNAQQQQQLIQDMKALVQSYGITSFYTVVEIKRPEEPIADFRCVLGDSYSPTLSSLATQTFNMIRQKSNVDLSQLTDN